MANDFLPWEKYPDLTEERLRVIAEIIRSVRAGAVGLHEPHNGDGEWCLGCRSYERTCFALRQAAEEHSWLNIMPETKALQFSFSIGSVPFRFYKGDPEDPPSHYWALTYGELHCIQLSLALEGMPPIDRVLRLAVETGPDREVAAVTLVECDEQGDVKNAYSIPLRRENVNVVIMQAPAVDLPPVVAQPLPEHSEQKKNKDDGINSKIG